MQPRSNEHMSLADFQRVVNELADIPVFFICLGGGEPFLHPKISDILKIAHGSFDQVLVLTNGSYITDEHMATIEEILRSKGEFSMQISLDAIDPKINDMTRGQALVTIKNIERLSDLGVHITIAMVITKYNIDSIIKSIDQLCKYTRHFNVMTLQNARTVHGIKENHGVNREDEAKLWHQLNEMARQRKLSICTPTTLGSCATGAPCASAFSYIVIDPSLMVRPCDRLTDIFIGDLKRSNILDIWNGPLVRPILKSPVPYCQSRQP
jgi:MoaA/NifB/PqqE/SkfB family radical SAM enzyme